MKALEKDRTRRYETANGFAADILRHLARRAGVAAPPSGAYRLRKFVRKNRGPVIAASLVLAGTGSRYGRHDLGADRGQAPGEGGDQAGTARRRAPSKPRPNGPRANGWPSSTRRRKRPRPSLRRPGRAGEDDRPNGTGLSAEQAAGANGPADAGQCAREGRRFRHRTRSPTRPSANCSTAQPRNWRLTRSKRAFPSSP